MLPLAILILSASMWGLTWWPLRYFHQIGVSDIPQLMICFGLGSLVLAPILWRERRQWRNEWHLLGLMLLLGGYANLAFSSAMIHGQVIRCMMLFYLAPVWGVLAARFFLKEIIDTRRWLGLTAAVAGAWLILVPGASLDEPLTGADLLALTAGLAFALNNIACRAAQSIPALSKTAAIFIGCALMATVTTAFIGTPLPQITPATWAWLAVFGVGWLLLASLASQWAVTRMQAGRAAILLSSELLVAVVSATLIGGETLNQVELLGGALILASTILEAGRKEPISA